MENRSTMQENCNKELTSHRTAKEIIKDEKTTFSKGQ